MLYESVQPGRRSCKSSRGKVEGEKAKGAAHARSLALPTHSLARTRMKSDKAKETLSKLGLKKVDGVTRVVIRKPKGVSPLPPSLPPRTPHRCSLLLAYARAQVLVAIQEPEVFKS